MYGLACARLLAPRAAVLHAWFCCTLYIFCSVLPRLLGVPAIACISPAAICYTIPAALSVYCLVHASWRRTCGIRLAASAFLLVRSGVAAPYVTTQARIPRAVNMSTCHNISLLCYTSPFIGRRVPHWLGIAPTLTVLRAAGFAAGWRGSCHSAWFLWKDDIFPRHKRCADVCCAARLLRRGACAAAARTAAALFWLPAVALQEDWRLACPGIG